MVPPGSLSGETGDARRADRRGACPDRRRRGVERGGEPRQARALRGHRRLPLQADRRAGRRTRAALQARTRARTDRTREGRSPRRRRACLPRDVDIRSGAIVIGKTQGTPISITGLGAYVPERVLRNDELATIVDTSDEWIMERTG